MSCCSVPPERDVEHLHATTQRQHRQVELDGGEGHRDVELVVDVGDAVEVVVGRFLAVAPRVHVAATGQQHAVEVLQHRERIRRQLVDGRHQHRHAASSGDRTRVRLAAAVGVALAFVGEGEDSGAEGDQRRRLAHRRHSDPLCVKTPNPLPQVNVRQPFRNGGWGR
jgi:hypothetical protein